MLRNLPVALVTQITDEFLMITAPWEQQNISVNELLRKQYAKVIRLKKLRHLLV